MRGSNLIIELYGGRLVVKAGRVVGRLSKVCLLLHVSVQSGKFFFSPVQKLL